MLFFLLLVFCCLPVFANQQPFLKPLSSYRLGFGVAAELLSAEAKLKLQPQGTLGQISSDYQHNTKKFQVAPTVEFGRTILDEYYLGLQISWRKSKAKSTAGSSVRGVSYTFAHEFKLKSYTDIFLKAGYKPSPQFMFYGLVGPSVSKWGYTTNLFYTNLKGEPQSLVNTFKSRETSVGLGLGLGVEYLAKNKYALSLEYTHHLNRSKKSTFPMEYNEQRMGRPFLRTGNITRSVQPSYSTIALRVTFFVSPF